MNLAGQLGMPGGIRSRREVIDVPEPRAERDDLARIIGVRKQRLDRLERESLLARAAWRTGRIELREAKECWRTAIQDAKDFWQQARSQFLAMTITSGQFRKAKAAYDRMKSEAAQRYADCKTGVQSCKEKRAQFFETRRQVMEAKRQQEKLILMRDDIRLSLVQEEW